ncbi:MAG TPA: FixH family protein [Puia sp.]|nr:FixH family protein [Puia sp.]
MNWGNRLIFVFLVFGGGISYMVYRCMQTPVDLVSARYYSDELAYQRVIDGTRRANLLSGKVQLTQTGAGVRVRLPVEMKDKPVKGTIQFYCPYDATRDRDVVLRPDADGVQDIRGEVLAPGRYVVKVSWESGGADYFNEQPFFIP